jgi:hypothetical protein
VAVAVVKITDAEGREEEEYEEEEGKEEVDEGRYTGNAPCPSNAPIASKSYKSTSDIAPPLLSRCCCCSRSSFFSFIFFFSSPS